MSNFSSNFAASNHHRPMEHKEDQAPKEHKPNWRETRATEEDIQNFLMGTLYLRHNVITGKDEFRVPEISEYAAMGI